MNILFYLHQYPAFGGIETVTTMLANAFAEDGHNVGIVSFTHKDGTDLLRQLNRQVMWYELPGSNLFAEDICKTLKEIFESFKPNSVIFQDSYEPIEHALFSVLDMLQGEKPALVIVEHSMPKVRLPLGRLSIADGFITLMRRMVGRFIYPLRYMRLFWKERTRRRILYSRADKYVFLSRRFISASNKIAGMDGGDKLAVLPNPVRNATIPPNLRAKHKEILYCGSLIKIKGVHRLLAIWSELEKRHPDWCFRIVGDGPERQRLEQQTKSAGLERVFFEGFQTDTERYYYRAWILVMASDFEGWPMVIGEAMQQGCVPVVYDSFCSAHDIIDDGVSGMVVRYFSRKAYVNVLEGLMDNDSLRKKMFVTDCEIASHYSINKIKYNWYKLLSDPFIMSNNEG